MIYLHHKFSVESVVLFIKDSHNDFAPASPILFPEDFIELLKGKRNPISRYFELYYDQNVQLRLSSVRVVFVFNTSPKRSASLSPMIFSIKQKTFELFLCCDFTRHHQKVAHS